METIKTTDKAIRTVVWLHAKVRERGLGLRPRLNTSRVYGAQRR